MDRGTEDRIEQYIRDPSQLSETERTDIARLIETNPMARAVAESLRGFYAEWKQPSSPIRLVPFRMKELPTALQGAKLAADTPARKRFEVLAVCQSEDDQVMARIMRDNQTRTGHVYLVSEAHTVAKVRITVTGQALSWTTDAQGIAHFSLDEVPEEIDWSNLELWIHPEA